MTPAQVAGAVAADQGPGADSAGQAWPQVRRAVAMAPGIRVTANGFVALRKTLTGHTLYLPIAGISPVT